MKKRIISFVCVFAMAMSGFVLIDTGTVSAESNNTKNAKRVPVLTYHHVANHSSGKLTISDEKFRKQMNWLKKNKWKTLTMQEFVEWYQGERTIPRKSVLITFDDGTRGVVKYAYPILKKNKQHATMFIIGAYVPKKRCRHISKSTINKLRKGKTIDIESHGYKLHDPIKAGKPAKHWSVAKLKKDCMKMKLKYGCTTMCYPWGGTGKKIRKALAETDYKVAFTYARKGEYQKKNKYAYRSSKRYLIPRITIPGNRSWTYIKKYVKLKK